MRKTFTKISGVLLASSILLTGCGNKGEKQIIGTWEREDHSKYATYQKDGKVLRYTIDSESTSYVEEETYKVEKEKDDTYNLIEKSSDYVTDFNIKFTEDGKTMYLKLDKGDDVTMVLHKVDEK